MVLASILQEQLLYGFVFVVMTRNPYVGLAAHPAIWFSMTWTFVHRNDPPPLDLHVHITELAMVWLGALLGVFFVAFVGTPRFVSAQLFENGRFTPWFFLFLLSVLGTVAGSYLIIDGDTMTGVPVLIIFAALVIANFVVYFAWLPHGVAQGKYILLFALLIATPAAYDYPILETQEEIRPWQGFIYFAALLLVTLIFYFFTVICCITDTERRWYKTRAESAKTIALIIGTVAIFYLAGFVADEIATQQFGILGSPEQQEQKIFVVLWGVIAAVIFLFIVGIIWLALRGGQTLQLATDFVFDDAKTAINLNYDVTSSSLHLS